MRETYFVRYSAKDSVLDPAGYKEREPVEVTKEELIAMLQDQNIIVHSAERRTYSL